MPDDWQGGWLTCRRWRRRSTSRLRRGAVWRVLRVCRGLENGGVRIDDRALIMNIRDVDYRC